MPEMFESLMYAARRELVITTPYYVPDEPIQAALCASARRGVDTTVVFPARNDSWIVAAASHSYYPQLLDAGVKIYEYEGGLLHTKSMTVDGETTLIGSANIDRRSFELNFENNILFVDRALTGAHARAAGELHRPLGPGRRRRRRCAGRAAGTSGTTRSRCSARCSEARRLHEHVGVALQHHLDGVDEHEEDERREVEPAHVRQHPADRAGRSARGCRLRPFQIAPTRGWWRFSTLKPISQLMITCAITMNQTMLRT